MAFSLAAPNLIAGSNPFLLSARSGGEADMDLQEWQQLHNNRYGHKIIQVMDGGFKGEVDLVFIPKKDSFFRGIWINRDGVIQRIRVRHIDWLYTEVPPEMTYTSIGPYLPCNESLQIRALMPTQSECWVAVLEI